MSIIYKFLPPDRRTYLGDQLLRFSQPAALNDPFECLPGLANEIAKEGIERIVSELKEVDSNFVRQLRENPLKIYDFFYRQAEANVNAHLGVFSLSGRWDSGLMWSHYTGSHSGFCLGFRRNHSFFTKSDLPNRIGPSPVIYSAHRVGVKFSRFTTDEVLRLLFTKSLDWQYEKEERLVEVLSHAKVMRNGNPYPVALFEVPHSALAEIVIGIRTDAGLKKELIEAGERLGIPVFQSVISQETFDIARTMVCGQTSIG